ncbi:MAG: hypothetical protein IT460_05860 [Planctomycetes bacterium]|nr:hypothetical protein [Planctomycetota bacterium]
MSRCEGVTTLSPLSGLTGLQSLNMSHCGGVTTLSPLSGLTGLQSLRVSGCKGVTTLSPLSGLTGLHSLDLSGCEGVTTLSPLSGLTGLQSLDLSWCEGVTTLSPLSGLTGLRSLSAGGATTARSFAPLRGLLPTLEHLFLYRGRFDDLDSALCGAHLQDSVLHRVRAHFAALDAQGASVDREGKLILLGNGRAGKTSLARLLRGERHRPDEASTHGIRLCEWTPEIALEGDAAPAPVDVHVWDFAGQDLYHNTHRLFFQARAAYVIVWDAFESPVEPDAASGYDDLRRPLAYWFDQVRSVAPDAPIVLVRTKTDRDRGREPPDWRTLVAPEYRATPCVEVSASRRADGEVLRLRELIGAAVAGALGPPGRRTLGRGRLAVKAALRGWREDDERRRRARQRPAHAVLERATFDDLVRTHCAGSPDGADSGALLDYLHHTGALYHRPGRLGGRIVLDQRWAIDVIYALFRERSRDQLVEGHGRFHPSDLHRWSWRRARQRPEDEALFLDFMVECDIAFRLLAADETARGEALYVATSMLPPRTAVEDAIDARLAGRRRARAARVTHPWLGEHLVLAFLRRAGEWFSRSALLWKYGALLPVGGGRGHLLVAWTRRGDGFGGTLEIEAYGEVGDTFERARTTLERLPGFPADARWSDAAAGAAPILTAERRRRTAPDDEGTAGPEADPTLAAVRPDRRTAVGRRIGLSYAGPDKKRPDRGAPADALVAALRVAASDVEVLSYRHEDDPTAAASEVRGLMRDLARSDVFVALVGHKYLRSAWCLNELYLAWRDLARSRDKRRTFDRARAVLFRLDDGRGPCVGPSAANQRVAEAWARLVEDYEREVEQKAGRRFSRASRASRTIPCREVLEFLVDESNRLKLMGLLHDFRLEEVPPGPGAALDAWAKRWAQELLRRVRAR